MRRAPDRLFVGDLWLALVGVDAELAQQPVDDDLEVELAHAFDDRLAGLVVGMDLESRVLLRQSLQGYPQLVLVSLGLGLDRDRDDRLGEDDRLQQIGWFSSVSVSPVVVTFRPTAAAMSPVKTSSTSSRRIACMRRMRPIRSFLPVDAFSTDEPARSRPE